MKTHNARKRLLYDTLRRAQVNPTAENLMDVVKVSRRVMAQGVALSWDDVQEVVEHVTGQPVLSTRVFRLPVSEGEAWPPPESFNIQMYQDAMGGSLETAKRARFADMARSGELGKNPWLKVDDYVGAWVHSSALQKAFPYLSDFLGLTLDEYADWTSGRHSLRKILFPKQKRAVS